jgi:hypothetical protein
MVLAVLPEESRLPECGVSGKTAAGQPGPRDSLVRLGTPAPFGIPATRARGVSLTSAAALQIKRSDLGHLSVGAPADVAVLRLEKGVFGYVDGDDLRHNGSQKLVCELTVREGQTVWDLNGLAGKPWKPDNSREAPRSACNNLLFACLTEALAALV